MNMGFYVENYLEKIIFYFRAHPEEDGRSHSLILVVSSAAKLLLVEKYRDHYTFLYVCLSLLPIILNQLLCVFIQWVKRVSHHSNLSKSIVIWHIFYIKYTEISSKMPVFMHYIYYSGFIPNPSPAICKYY